MLGIDENEGEQITLSIDLYDSLITADVIDPDEETRREAVERFVDDLGVLDDLEDIEITNEDISDTFDIDVEDDFTITITAEDIREFVYDAFEAALEIEISFEVVEAVEKPRGKWPAPLGNVIMIDA